MLGLTESRRWRHKDFADVVLEVTRFGLDAQLVWETDRFSGTAMGLQTPGVRGQTCRITLDALCTVRGAVHLIFCDPGRHALRWTPGTTSVYRDTCAISMHTG